MKMICGECKKEYNGTPENISVCPSCGSALTPARLGDTARVLISFLIFLVMIAYVYLIVFSVTLKNAFSEESIEDFVNRLDLMSFSAEGVDIIPAEGRVIPEDADIAEAISSVTVSGSPDADGIRLIYERGTFRSFIANELAEYGRFISDGDIPNGITAEKAKINFDENLELIDSIADTPLTDTDIENVRRNIDSFDEFFEGMTPENFARSLGGKLIATRIFCSVWFPVLTGVILAGMLILLGAVNGSCTYALFWGGSAALFSSSGLLILRGTVSAFAEAAGNNAAGGILRCAADGILPMLHIFSIIFIAAGFIMIICASMMRKKTASPTDVKIEN